MQSHSASLLTEDLFCGSTTWFENTSKREATLREDASWRRMFPVQLPARIERITRIADCYCGQFDSQGVIRPEFENLQVSGARMGFIYDILVHFLEY